MPPKTIAPNLPFISVDSSALTRIIYNLLTNAIKFTPEGGIITVNSQSINSAELIHIAIPEYTNITEKLSSCRQLLKLSIKDTGNGIPVEDQARIFERFVQSLRTGRLGVGTGLGLAYCKMAIETLGGIIWVKSEVGLGSEFIILLPIPGE